MGYISSLSERVIGSSGSILPTLSLSEKEEMCPHKHLCTVALDVEGELGDRGVLKMGRKDEGAKHWRHICNKNGNNLSYI